MSNEPIEGEVLNTMPAAAIVATENPYQALVATLAHQGKVAEMRELLALQREWDADKAKKAYTGAMAAFKAEPISIVKDKLVEFETNSGLTSYKHATLAGVVDAVVPAMGRHGLSHRWDTKQEGGQITVICSITHRDGHSESVQMSAAPDASGKKNSIQQVASTVTYLQRYTLMALCGVAAADQGDDDGRAYGSDDVEYITEEQLNALQVLVDEWVVNKPKFLDWISSGAGFKVTSLGEIPARLFDEVNAKVGEIRAARIAAREEQGNG